MHDGLLDVADGPHDLDGARQHHEEPRVLIAHLEQHLAGRDLAPVPQAGDAVDLRRRQLRKHLRGALERGVGHAFS